MSIKGTVTISREEAIDLIKARLYDANDKELSQALTLLCYGDNIKLEYFGHNFDVDSGLNQNSFYDDVIVDDTEDELIYSNFNNEKYEKRKIL